MLEVHHLTRYYDDFLALHDVSFTVGEGQIVGLLGLNGAGKSTTLKILAGLLPPSEGHVTLDRTRISPASADFHARIGYLPEDPPLYLDMTVRDFLTHIGRMKGMPIGRVRARLPEVMATAQLDGREDQVIETLSHGYRKRVGIAQAIIHDPRLVILDEPISGLDPVQIVEMRNVVRNLREGRAVLVSSHILSEIHQTCDRILVLRDGDLVAQGTEEELTRQLHEIRLRIVVRGTADALRGALGTHESVASIDAVDTDGDVSTATVTLSKDDRETLAAALIQAGLGLRVFEEAKSALEELFLGLTTKAEAA